MADEDACREALFELRWRDGLVCPACGNRGFCALRTRQVFQCNRCKKQLRLTAGTVFENTKLPLTSWFLAIYHLTQSKGGISSIELGRRLGVKQPTAWLIKHKLMRAMAGREAQKPKLAGRIEIDDAYLGGERSGGKRGRGAAGKTPVVAAVETTAERKPRRLKLTVVKGFRKKEVETIAKRDFMPGSNVVSDGLSCWPAVEQAGCTHFPMRHRLGQAAPHAGRRSVGQHHAGQHQDRDRRHLPSRQRQARRSAISTSFAYRFNRRYQLDSIVERLAWAAAAHCTPALPGHHCGCVKRIIRFYDLLPRWTHSPNGTPSATRLRSPGAVARC